MHAPRYGIPERSAIVGDAPTLQPRMVVARGFDGRWSVYGPGHLGVSKRNWSSGSRVSSAKKYVVLQRNCCASFARYVLIKSLKKNDLHDNCYIRRQQRENHSSTLPNSIRRKAIKPISLQQADGERLKNFQVLKKVEGRNSLHLHI